MRKPTNTDSHCSWDNVSIRSSCNNTAALISIRLWAHCKTRR
jgi:hypothetical protein